MTWRLTNKCSHMAMYLTICLKAFTSFLLLSLMILTESVRKHSLSYKTAIVANYTKETRH